MGFFLCTVSDYVIAMFELRAAASKRIVGGDGKQSSWHQGEGHDRRQKREADERHLFAAPGEGLRVVSEGLLDPLILKDLDSLITYIKSFKFIFYLWSNGRLVGSLVYGRVGQETRGVQQQEAEAQTLNLRGTLKR
ncbi:hypothetical protein ABEB36_010895, partial [Hypothenemus hampei]